MGILQVEIFRVRVSLILFVIYDIFAGKTLLLGIGEHCFAKKELKTLAFS